MINLPWNLGVYFQIFQTNPHNFSCKGNSKLLDLSPMSPPQALSFHSFSGFRKFAIGEKSTISGARYENDFEGRATWQVLDYFVIS